MGRYISHLHTTDSNPNILFHILFKVLYNEHKQTYTHIYKYILSRSLHNYQFQNYIKFNKFHKLT